MTENRRGKKVKNAIIWVVGIIVAVLVGLAAASILGKVTDQPQQLPTKASVVSTSGGRCC